MENTETYTADAIVAYLFYRLGMGFVKTPKRTLTDKLPVNSIDESINKYFKLFHDSAHIVSEKVHLSPKDLARNESYDELSEELRNILPVPFSQILDDVSSTLVKREFAGNEPFFQHVKEDIHSLALSALQEVMPVNSEEWNNLDSEEKALIHKNYKAVTIGLVKDGYFGMTLPEELYSANQILKKTAKRDFRLVRNSLRTLKSSGSLSGFTLHTLNSNDTKSVSSSLGRKGESDLYLSKLFATNMEVKEKYDPLRHGPYHKYYPMMVKGRFIEVQRIQINKENPVLSESETLSPTSEEGRESEESFIENKINKEEQNNKGEQEWFQIDEKLRLLEKALAQLNPRDRMLLSTVLYRNQPVSSLAEVDGTNYEYSQAAKRLRAVMQDLIN